MSVGSGIFQLSCYLIAISANAGCMDLGFIVGGQRTLVKQGNLLSLTRPGKNRRHPVIVSCLYVMNVFEIVLDTCFAIGALDITKTQICTRNLSGFSFLPSLADGPDLRQNLASSKSQRRESRDSSRKTKGCQLYPQTHV